MAHFLKACISLMNEIGELFMYFLFSITSRTSRLYLVTVGSHGAERDCKFPVVNSRGAARGSRRLLLGRVLRSPFQQGLVRSPTRLAAFPEASGCYLLCSQGLGPTRGLWLSLPGVPVSCDRVHAARAVQTPTPATSAPGSAFQPKTTRVSLQVTCDRTLSLNVPVLPWVSGPPAAHAGPRLASTFGCALSASFSGFHPQFINKLRVRTWRKERPRDLVCFSSHTPHQGCSPESPTSSPPGPGPPCGRPHAGPLVQSVTSLRRQRLRPVLPPPLPAASPALAASGALRGPCPSSHLVGGPGLGLPFLFTWW